eukprot:SAG31_NODE_172_length_21357_cov_7.616021_15_plen_116_part_00
MIDGQVAPESLLKGTMFDNPVAGATKGGSNRLPNIPNIGVKLPGFGGEEDKDDSEVDPRFRPLLDQATAAFQLLKRKFQLFESKHRHKSFMQWGLVGFPILISYCLSCRSCFRST